jgi:hypothetical protein
VKNITFSAKDEAIERAREEARRNNKTLNDAFREWLDSYGGRSDRVREFDELMKRLEHVNINRKYTREEMNARGKPGPVLP